MMKRHGTPAAAALVFGFGLMFTASTAAHAQLGISVGSNVYGSDEFCLNSEAFLTDAEVSYSGDMVGASASAMNSDIPWMPPPGSGGQNTVFPASALLVGAQQEDQYLSQGEAFQAAVEVFPFAVVRRLSGTEREGFLGRLDRNLRPYVGAGLIIVTDGEAAPAGGDRDLPTFAMRSFTAPVVTYGARLYLPSRESAVSVVLQYRGTSAFVSDGEYEGPDGSVISVGDETLTWGTWTAGFSFRIGG